MNQKSVVKGDRMQEPVEEEMIIEEDDELIRFFECLCTIEKFEENQNNFVPKFVLKPD